MKRVACWSAADARDILATEALEGGEGRFLAVHMPITGFEVEGSAASEVRKQDEAGLLDALGAEGVRHAFCVVEGEPGSGKSHLIRWLRLMWPREADCVLLLQRADGSLDGALRQLRQRLPAGYGDLLDVLGNVQQIGDRGRWANFLSVLANSLRPDYFNDDIRLGDEDFCDERKLRDLFASSVVAERWTAPTRLLEVLSGKGAERNSQIASFTASDVLEILQFESRVRNVPVATLNLLRRLKGEREHLQRQFGTLAPGSADEPAFEGIAPETTGVVRALNRRLNHALQFFLGIGKDKLKDLFLELRRRLRADQKRLVLLLEDITSFQGVDNQLIDALVTQSSTRETDDLCDLISVVGITPAFFREHLATYGNYRARITHHILLGRKVQKGLQDVAMLRDADGPVTLASYYLRAVRAGTTTIDAWRERARRAPEPVPNRCTTCEHRAPCHDAFGQHEGVGLYPFTGRTLGKMFYALQDRTHAGMTLQTPRGMIQGVLAPTLRRPDVLTEGRYPGPELETEYLRDQENENLDERQSAAIGALELSAEDKPRIRRLVTWWGSSAEQPAVEGSDGARAFFAVSEGVFDALDVPWPGEARGEDKSEDESRRPLPRPSSPPKREEEGAPPGLDVPPKWNRGASSGGGEGATPPKPPPPPLRGPKTLPLKKRQAQIDAWRPTKPNAGASSSTGVKNRLEDHQFWQTTMFTVARELPWHTIGVSPWEHDRFIKETTFVFEGSQQIRAENIVIPHEPWVTLGLKAWLEAREGKSRDSQWNDELQRRMVRFLRRLAKLIADQIDERRTRGASGESWPIEKAMTTVLVGRAWLRGSTSPDRPLTEQWREILSDEDDARSNPKTRTEKWSEALNTTLVHHDIRDRLVHSIRLRAASGDADSDGLLLYDASDSARALTAMIERWEFPDPPHDSRKQRELDVSVIRSFLGLARALDAVPKKELARLSAQAREIHVLRHGSSFTERCSQVRAAMDRVERIDPRLAPEYIEEWRKAESDWKRLLTQGSVRDADIDEIFGRLVADVERLQASETPSAKLLAWEIGVHVDVVDEGLTLLKAGDKAVLRLLDRVKSTIETAGTSGGGLPALRSFGSRVQAAASAIRSKLETKDD